MGRLVNRTTRMAWHTWRRALVLAEEAQKALLDARTAQARAQEIQDTAIRRTIRRMSTRAIYCAFNSWRNFTEWSLETDEQRLVQQAGLVRLGRRVISHALLRRWKTWVRKGWEISSAQAERDRQERLMSRFMGRLVNRWIRIAWDVWLLKINEVETVTEMVLRSMRNWQQRNKRAAWQIWADVVVDTAELEKRQASTNEQARRQNNLIARFRIKVHRRMAAKVIVEWFHLAREHKITASRLHVLWFRTRMVQAVGMWRRFTINATQMSQRHRIVEQLQLNARHRAFRRIFWKRARRALQTWIKTCHWSYVAAAGRSLQCRSALVAAILHRILERINQGELVMALRTWSYFTSRSREEATKAQLKELHAVDLKHAAVYRVVNKMQHRITFMSFHSWKRTAQAMAQAEELRDRQHLQIWRVRRNWLLRETRAAWRAWVIFASEIDSTRKQQREADALLEQQLKMRQSALRLLVNGKYKLILRIRFQLWLHALQWINQMEQRNLLARLSLHGVFERVLRCRQRLCLIQWVNVIQGMVRLEEATLWLGRHLVRVEFQKAADYFRRWIQFNSNRRVGHRRNALLRLLYTLDIRATRENAIRRLSKWSKVATQLRQIEGVQLLASATRHFFIRNRRVLTAHRFALWYRNTHLMMISGIQTPADLVALLTCTVTDAVSGLVGATTGAGREATSETRVEAASYATSAASDVRDDDVSNTGGDLGSEVPVASKNSDTGALSASDVDLEVDPERTGI